MNRRRWYLLLHAPLALWVAATIAVVAVHRFFEAGGWLMVHLLLLGAVSTAILIWSQHFADAVLRRPAPGARVSHGMRVATHTVGVALVVAGIVTTQWLLILTGGIVVGFVALTHATSLTLQLRGALPARFAPLVRYYVAASLALIVGVGLGVTMARADLGADLHERLYVAHVTVNLLGWVGLTVVGTVILLWPTVLHARVSDDTGRTARNALWLLVAGVLFTAGASVADVRAIVAAGILLYLAGLGLVIADGVRQARQARPTTFAAWSMAAAFAWFFGCTLAFGVMLTTTQDADQQFGVLVTVFAGGFAAQIVVAALSYLLPVVLGGGPEVSRRTAAELDRGAAFRVAVVNAGGLLYVLPVPSLVRVVVSLVVFAVLVSFVWFAVRAIVASKRPLKRTAPRATTAGGITAAAAVLVLAVSGGIALDPAAAGIGTASTTSTSAATGNTTTVEVVMRDTRFVPDVIEVPAGDVLVIVLTNADDMDHDLTLENGLRTDRIHAGESVEFEVGIVANDLDGWCSIAGHRLLGMVLTIIAVGDAPDAFPGPHAGHNDGDPGSQPPTAPPVFDHAAEPEPGFAARDATLPPASEATAPEETVHRHTFTVQEVERAVAPGITQTLWTFGGTAPGPTLRGKVGDRFEITLVNDGTIGHSIDFHAGALAPDEPMRTIQPGETLTYNFTATRSGIWMYHCATMPMALHIANGMFGAVIIDPPGLAAVDREFVLVQSEFYLGANGAEADPVRLRSQHPDLVAFNGYANQYVHEPLTARVGERVRVWVLDVGPNRPSSFHIVGGQFDTVFFEGDYLLKDGGSTGTGGSQALALQPAQGGFVELVFPEAGHYPFVSHIMSDGEKGGSGIFRITE